MPDRSIDSGLLTVLTSLDKNKKGANKVCLAGCRVHAVQSRLGGLCGLTAKDLPLRMKHKHPGIIISINDGHRSSLIL
jgi:hypothetical protein